MQFSANFKQKLTILTFLVSFLRVFDSKSMRFCSKLERYAYNLSKCKQKTALSLQNESIASAR